MYKKKRLLDLAAYASSMRLWQRIYQFYACIDGKKLYTLTKDCLLMME